MRRIAVLGLGAMGAALAETLIAAGRPLVLWNRSPERAAAFSGRGVTIASSPFEALAETPLVLACLLDYRAVSAVLEPVSGHLEGRTLVNLTNGTPQEARRMAEWVAARGGRYLDGGIMAIPQTVGSPEAFVVYSGATAAFDMASPVLEAFGRAHFLGRDAGLAALCDLALLSAMYGLFGGFLHGTALARSGGIEPRAFAGLAGPWIEAMTGALPHVAEQIERGDYDAAGGSSLAMQTMAVENILAVSGAGRVDPALVAPMRDLMARRIAAGGGGEDIAALIEEIAPRGMPGSPHAPL